MALVHGRTLAHGVLCFAFVCACHALELTHVYIPLVSIDERSALVCGFFLYGARFRAWSSTYGVFILRFCIRIICGYQDVVKVLLQRGAGVNSKDKDNITALMEASIMDHRDVVKHLLKVRSRLSVAQRLCRAC